MIKVFLAEDEFIVREGIKNNVDWSGHGYDFCGEASDGELALPMIRKLKPDIVITDIRMPFMDGLQLSRMIKKELPDTEIMILSGYGEFEYAKTAIQIGVSSYLLKPINGEDLLKEIDKLSEKIRERRKDSELREKYLREIEEKYIGEKKQLFTQLVTGASSVSELLESGSKLEIDLSALWYQIVLVGFSARDRGYDEYSRYLVEAGAKLSEINSEPHCIIFDRDLEGYAILYKADSKEELTALYSGNIERMKHMLEGFSHLRYFGGIGTPVNRLSELSVSFRMASRAYAHRYLGSESAFLDSNDLSTVKKVDVQQNDFNMAAVDPRGFERSKITKFLREAGKDEAEYFIGEFFSGVNKAAMNSTIFRQYITMEFYFAAADFAEELEEDRGKISQPKAGLSHDEAIRYMTEIVEQAINLREAASSNRYRDIVRKVKAYIEEHYADENLSLNELAVHVNFSASHLSMIFGQETGVTFIRYLTDYRMERAKAMLRMTGMKSSEIGEAVGYRDPHYFSYLFKKTMGMTPTQYRDGGRK